MFQKVDDARTRAGSVALARASSPDDLGVYCLQQFLQLANRAESGRSLFRCTKKEGVCNRPLLKPVYIEVTFRLFQTVLIQHLVLMVGVALTKLTTSTNDNSRIT